MNEKILNKLEIIEKYTRGHLILQLYLTGVTQEGIAKKLKIAKKEVNDFLKGVSKNKN